MLGSAVTNHFLESYYTLQQVIGFAYESYYTLQQVIGFAYELCRRDDQERCKPTCFYMIMDELMLHVKLHIKASKGWTKAVAESDKKVWGGRYFLFFLHN